MGDPAGIGGEIILKSLPSLCKKSIPVIFGDRSVLNALSYNLFEQNLFPFAPFGKGGPGDAEFVDMNCVRGRIEYGKIRPQCGKASFKYLVEAIKQVLSGKISALVTSPINKASFHLADVPFTGHTELLAHYGGVADYVMMMANRSMRVSLATIHIPLKSVPGALSVRSIFKTIAITHDALRSRFGIVTPLIRVCGLNPHAGESGLMGDEEGMIEEAIQSARVQGIDAEGPFPADTLFHRRDCDAFVAMYHDQGLIPVKTLDFKRTVNITLGLPFIRTSPGHGTGFDIAGKGVADPTGLIEAYRTAEKMTRRLK